MPLSNIDVTIDKKQVVRTMNHLSDKVWIVTALGVIMSLFLTACTSTTPITPKPEILTQSDPVVQETTDLPEPVITSTTEELPPAVTAEELKRLREEIDAKIQQAIEDADPVRKILFEMSQRVGLVADLFANNLTNPENPADRILDPDSFSIGLTPDGIAYLKLEVDSFWGKAGEVAIIDMGDDKGMFVSLADAGVDNGTFSLNAKGYYAVATDESGAIVAAVDSSRQWTSDLTETSRLPEVDISQQMAEAYLNGEIIYPTSLTEEQEVAFENALAEVEPDLSEKQRRQIIVHRFQRESEIFEGFERKINAFDALVNKDGNLEYYDGTWHTLEAMRNLKGEIIPWGETYDMVSEEGQNGILNNTMAGNEDLMNEHNRIFYIMKENEEKAGFDNSGFNVLFVQFFPDVESLTRKKVSKEMGYYDMKGQIIVKNRIGKIFVINVETCLNTGILHTYVKSENVFSQNHNKLYAEKAFDNGYLGIPSGDYLSYRFNDLASLANEPDEKTFVEQILNSNMENFLQKLETTPGLISKDLYHISFIIYPNY